MVDALVAKAEEGRCRQRKRWGVVKQTMIQRFPNRVTCSDESRSAPTQVGGVSWGTETSKYPEEKKAIDCPTQVGLNSVSSGERKRRSPNSDASRRVVGSGVSSQKNRRITWNS